MPSPPVEWQDSGSKRVTFSDAAPAVAPASPQQPAHDEEEGAANGLDGGSDWEQQHLQHQQQQQADDPGSSSRGWYARFKAAVKALKHEVLAIYYAIHDPRTPFTAKLLPWIALAYALSPLDLIPDFIPVLGFLDDMLLLPGLLWLAVKLIPPEIMADARQRAHVEPLRLHRNWGVATLIFVLWTALAMLLAHLGFQRWADAEARPYEWAVLAGTGGACAIAFVTWMVSVLQHEARERDEWSEVLNAPLNPPDSSDSE